MKSKTIEIDGDKLAAFLNRAEALNSIERRRLVEQAEVKRLFAQMLNGYYEELEQNIDASKMTFTFRAVITRSEKGASRVKAVAAVKPLPIGGELDSQTEDPDQHEMSFDSEEDAI
jgi:hypothetical protein